MAYDVETLVVGCGNLLFKDDGFGPLQVQPIIFFHYLVKNGKN